MKKNKSWTQIALENAVMYGLNFDQIVQKYGRRFAANLFNYLEKNTKKSSKKKDKEFYLIYPKKITFKKENLSDQEKKEYYKKQQELLDEYKDLLKDSSIPLRSWVEDFVDEDTGEVVSIDRMVFLPLF